MVLTEAVLSSDVELRRAAAVTAAEPFLGSATATTEITVPGLLDLTGDF